MAAADSRLIEEARVSSSSILLATAGALLLLALGALLQLLRLRRRGALLQDLHALADAQETALRALRTQLASAHAEILTLTDQPAPHADETAFTAALREQLAHRLWLTEVEAEPQGDAWFPAWPRDAFEQVSREHHDAQAGTPAFDFVLYERRAAA